jgi:hypothetical protein
MGNESVSSSKKKESNELPFLAFSLILSFTSECELLEYDFSTVLPYCRDVLPIKDHHNIFPHDLPGNK